MGMWVRVATVHRLRLIKAMPLVPANTANSLNPKRGEGGRRKRCQARGGIRGSSLQSG